MAPRLGARRRISPPPVQRAVRSARASARPRKYGGSLAAATVVSAGARRAQACWWHVGARRVPADAAGAPENPADLRGRVLVAHGEAHAGPAGDPAARDDAPAHADPGAPRDDGRGLVGVGEAAGELPLERAVTPLYAADVPRHPAEVRREAPLVDLDPPARGDEGRPELAQAAAPAAPVEAEARRGPRRVEVVDLQGDALPAREVDRPAEERARERLHRRGGRGAREEDEDGDRQRKRETEKHDSKP